MVQFCFLYATARYVVLLSFKSSVTLKIWMISLHIVWSKCQMIMLEHDGRMKLGFLNGCSFD